MPSTPSLLNVLKQDFPAITFTESTVFRWSPSEHTVYYKNTKDIASLLHEVAHGVLGHTEYARDIELIRTEREAWDMVVATLARRYKVTVDQEQIEDALDTYRDWLHSRSLCPSCQATGVQTDKNLYSCLACTTTWRVNEARTCALRRYKIK